MEVKNWTYEEFPDYTEETEGAVFLKTTGDERAVYLHRDVVYANVDGVDLHLQILLPSARNETGRKYPCLVYVQGSAWMKQDVYKGLPLVSKLAARGYVVAVAEYRHSGIAPFPAQIQDARNAVRFMKVHGEEYQVDVEKIFLGGSSSGGHTAMFGGIFQEEDEQDASLYPGVSAKVSGILDYYGAVNLMWEDSFPSTIEHHLPDSPEGRLMGGMNLREHPELCEKATAECQITSESKLPPVLIFHGTKDRTVNVRQSVSLYRKLKECGKEARLYLILGADHGGAEFWMDEALDVADDFMKEILERKVILRKEKSER